MVPQPTNHWPLNENAGQKAHDVVARRTAVLHNGPTFGPGRAANALNFDGVDDNATSCQVDIHTSASRWRRGCT